MEALIIVSLLLLLALAAGRRGLSSQYDLNDPEWERHRSWRGFTPFER
jgi:hypothetical protein